MTGANEQRPYLFDARSARWTRTTGWERYTREVAKRIAVADPLVRVRATGSEALPSRLWQDAVATPLAVHGVRVAHFPTFPPVAWARPRRCVAYTLHDLVWWRYAATASRMGREYYGRLARRAVNGHVHVVTDTRAVAEELLSDFSLSRDAVTVVPLGVSLPKPTASLRRSRPYLLTVGTLEPRKNLDGLAAAYQRSGVARSHDLLVVGRLGWGERPPGVEILSDLDDAALAATYAGATALVLPSLYEGFGLPVVEAMQMDVPVVCSDLPVLREVSGGWAHFIDPRDEESLIEGLRFAITAVASPEATAWARRTWTWEATVTALSTLYRRLDADGPRVRM